MRIRLLQSLVKPCLLYGVESWTMTPEILAKIIAAERALTRWCLRMSRHTSGTENAEESLAAWIKWKTDSAREIARLMEKTKNDEVAHIGITATLAVGRAHGQKTRLNEPHGGNLLRHTQQTWPTPSAVVGHAKRI